LGKIAATEHKRLSAPNSKDFLAWFAEQKPVPKKNPHMNSPLDPGFNLPETKDFSVPKLPENPRLDPLLPGLPGGDKQDTSTIPEATEKAPADKESVKEPAAEKAADNPPAEKTTAPANETTDSKGEEKQATETKAEETKPSETKSAEEPPASNNQSDK
jgi:hypothetical protein